MMSLHQLKLFHKIAWLYKIQKFWIFVQKRLRRFYFFHPSPSPFIISDFLLASAKITVTSLSAVDLSFEQSPLLEL